MSIEVHREFIGNYRKLKNSDGIVYGMLPKKLNPNPKFYGKLENKLDLNIGKESFKNERGEEKLGSILMFIEEYARRKGSKCLREVLDSDFVSSRSLLFTIAKSVYESAGSAYGSVPSSNEFEFQAVRYKDVIFLFVTGEEYTINYQRGYKFNQYMTLDEDEEPHDPNTPVSNAEHEKVVLRTELKKENESIKMCYGAEVDAIDSDGKYVKLRTFSDVITNYWYEKRSLAAWLQSYLGNIPTTMIGHHFQNRVYEVSTIKTADIPSMSDQIKWKPEKCMEKLFDVLDQVKKSLEENGMARCYKYSRDGLESEPMDPKDCDFVGKSFIDQFE